MPDKDEVVRVIMRLCTLDGFFDSLHRQTREITYKLISLNIFYTRLLSIDSVLFYIYIIPFLNFSLFIWVFTHHTPSVL